MKIAIIPARGGSKRIPKKNIKVFRGRPVISYAIDAAKKSQLFDKIVVSTDDERISQTAQKYGAEVPFIRPKSLSDDKTSSVDVIKHCLKHLNQNKLFFEDVCCIYPCVPFLKKENLIKSFRLYSKRKDKFCIAISEFPSSIERALKKGENNLLKPLVKKNEVKRTQDLKNSYFDAGQFYWGQNKLWLQNISVHSNSVGFEIDSLFAVDIDNQSDWKKAETLFDLFKKSS